MKRNNSYSVTATEAAEEEKITAIKKVVPSPFSLLNPLSRASPTDGGSGRPTHSGGRGRVTAETASGPKGERRRRRKRRTVAIKMVRVVGRWCGEK